MSYTDHFKLADDLIAHLDTVVAAIADPFIASRYTGFVAVAAVTVFELAIKDIFCNFGDTKHRVLGSFTRSYFDRINGKIKYKVLHDEYVKCFGDKYVVRFKKQTALRDKEYLRDHGKSVLTAYNNVIIWRNSFAHEGKLPAYATYRDVVDSYRVGKELIHCLASSMKR